MKCKCAVSKRTVAKKVEEEEEEEIEEEEGGGGGRYSKKSPGAGIVEGSEGWGEKERERELNHECLNGHTTLLRMLKLRYCGADLEQR